MRREPCEWLRWLSYGGGTNSTALAIEYVKRKLPIDLITFADTGGERPETYAYVKLFSEWLEGNGYPAIITVQITNAEGEPYTLEQDCLRRHALPSVAYGFKTCSQRWKTRPQEDFVKRWDRAQEAWKNEEQIIKLIGFDADEPQRAKPYQDKLYFNQYPLVSWGMGRQECVKTIVAAGLPLPGKSSCFFCPNMKDYEIRRLVLERPELADRAIAMEQNAQAHLSAVKGLGRDFKWADVVDFYNRQTDFTVPQRQAFDPCGCYDGEAPGAEAF